MTNISNFVLTVKQHYPIVLIFATLFIVFIISSVQADRLLKSEINANEQLQIDSMEVQNDFRNTTIAYLANLTHIVNEQGKQIDKLEQTIYTLEQKIINNDIVL